MSLKEQIVSKLLSGRFYLTVIGGIVFAFAVWKRIMPPEATASILTSIFTSYFMRSDRNGKEIVK